MVLDPQHDATTGRTGEALHVQRIRDVAEVDIVGAGANRLPSARVRDGAQGRASAKAGPCASSAFVAAIIRRYIASRSACGSGPAFAIVTRRSTSRSCSTSAIALRPAASLARPTSRPSSARSFSSPTMRRSSASIFLQPAVRGLVARPPSHCAASGAATLRTARRSCRAR